MCKATLAMQKLFFVSLFTWRKVTSIRQVTRCFRTRNSPLVVALGQRKIHVNSDRCQAVHQAKLVPEQDCSVALLKVEHIVLDRLSKPSLNTFVEVKITTGLLISEFEATATGSRFNPNATQRSLFSHAFQVYWHCHII